MGNYNFETAPNRLGQHTYKWKEAENDREVLAAWIADMDFEVLPEVRQTVHDYAEQLVYGYTYASDSLIQSVLDWEKEEHGYVFEKDALVFIEGVVPAISIAIQAFTQEGDAVLINTPVYPPFARSIELNNRKLITNSLIEEDGLYQIDFEQLEKDLAEHDVKVYVFCNPHNPGGRVWEKEILEKIGRLCQQLGVILVSDEIHQDLIFFGNKHCSFNTVSPDFKDFTLILSSATKTFNIAGTKNSYVVIENPKLRKKFQQRQLANNHHEVSSLGFLATEAAYRYGKPWLTELKAVLEDNIDFVVVYFSQHAPRVKVMKPQGTYLIWLDFSAYNLTDEELFQILRQKAKVVLNRGTDFGKEGKNHARLNVAAPKSIIEEICKRIAENLPH